jgi:hypothetical protein
MAVILSRRAQESWNFSSRIWNPHSPNSGSSTPMDSSQVMAAQRHQRIPAESGVTLKIIGEANSRNSSRGPSNDGEDFVSDPKQGRGVPVSAWHPRTHPARTISIYTSDSFIGRDQRLKIAKPTRRNDRLGGKELRTVEILGRPHTSRGSVDSLTRARWQQFTMEVLERWIALHMPLGTSFGGSMDGRDGPHVHDVPSPRRCVGHESTGAQWTNCPAPCLTSLRLECEYE